MSATSASRTATAQAGDVVAVLTELGIDAEKQQAKLIEVWNKIDRLSLADKEQLQAAAARRTDAVTVSAIDGEGVDGLLALIDRRLSSSRTEIDVAVDHADGALLAWLHAHGDVVNVAPGDDVVHVTVALDDVARSQLERRQSRTDTAAPPPSSNGRPA